MKWPLVFAVPIWFLLVAASPPPTPSSVTSPPVTPTPTASPSPSPTPIPSNAFLSLDVTAGGPNTQITVNGGAFLPNEQMTLYWDQATKVAGGANADSSGNFTTHVKPFAGDAPGVHKLCASVPPNPCANFSLEAAATTPSPSPSPSPTESPSPTPVATASADSSPTPVAATLNGLDVISKPPLVFLPLVGGLAIAISLAYWVFSVVRRPRQTTLPTAAVVHRAMRPDYTAGFGTAPAEPEQAAAAPSAWDDVVPRGTNPPPPAEAAPPQGQAEAPSPPSPPQQAWPRAAETQPPTPHEPDEPPELPEPGE